MSWSWFRFPMLVGLVFSVGWTSLVFGLSVFATSARPSVGMVLFPVVGIGFVYSTSCGVFNRSTLSIGKTGIAARNGPLPSHVGSKRIEADRIHDVQVDRVGWIEPPYGWPYVLRLRTTTGDRIKLASGLMSAEKATYVEIVVNRLFDGPPE